MTLVMEEVLKHMPEDTQITFGSSNHTAWGHRYFPNSFYRPSSRCVTAPWAIRFPPP